MSTSSTVTLYDTTLRDGAQGEGIHFSLADKLRIAQRLDTPSACTISRGGWPGSNEKDIEFFREAKKLKFKAREAGGIGSTRRANTPVENDPQVELLLEGRNAGRHTRLQDVHPCTSRKSCARRLEENLAMIRETIAYLVKNGARGHLRWRAHV